MSWSLIKPHWALPFTANEEQLLATKELLLGSSLSKTFKDFLPKLQRQEVSLVPGITGWFFLVANENPV